MKIADLKKLIVSRIKTKNMRPILIESSPGLGKTEIVEQVAIELGIGFKVIHAPLLQPEDYGFPVIDKKTSDVDFVVSKDKFPIEGADCPDIGLLLIDELSQADANAQKILANMMQAREIHGKKMKKEWFIVATGNRTVDRAGANRLLSHLGNRVTRIGLDACVDSWTQWALSNGVKPEVIAFIRFRPDLLTNFNPQQEINATPRSWAQGISRSLGEIDPSLEFETYKGDIGEGPASEFLGFLGICRKLPSIDAILLAPDTTQVPTDLATLYAICGALAHKTTVDNFGRIMTYIARMPEEFSVLFVRDAIAKNKELAKTKDFIQWASGPGAKLLT